MRSPTPSIRPSSLSSSLRRRSGSSPASFSSPQSYLCRPFSFLSCHRAAHETFVSSQHGLRRPGALVLFLATLLMYASAVFYWVSLLLNAVGVYNIVQAYEVQFHCQARLCELRSSGQLPSSNDCLYNYYGLPGTIRGLTLCAPTIILSVNVRSMRSIFATSL